MSSRALWLRSAVGRPLPAVGIAAVAAFTVITAVLAPLLLRATEQAALRAALAPAGSATDIVVQLEGTDDTDRGKATDELSRLAGTTGARGGYGPAVTTLRSARTVAWQLPGAAPATTRSRCRPRRRPALRGPAIA